MSEQAQQTVADIRAGIARLSNLISQLLTLKRVQAGQEKAVDGPQTAQCLKVVTSVVEDIYWEAESKEIAVEVAGFDTNEAQSACAAMPEASLFCLVRNLVHNAVHYVPQGGSVTIAFRQTGDRLSLCVAALGFLRPSEAVSLTRFTVFWGRSRRAPDWDWPFAKQLRIVMAVPLCLTGPILRHKRG